MKELQEKELEIVSGGQGNLFGAKLDLYFSTTYNAVTCFEGIFNGLSMAAYFTSKNKYTEARNSLGVLREAVMTTVFNIFELMK